MNIYEYIDKYIQSKNTSYDNDKESMITEMLSPDEKRLYDYIKESDKQRLIKFS